jgi:hypothetical protein
MCLCGLKKLSATPWFNLINLFNSINRSPIYEQGLTIFDFRSTWLERGKNCRPLSGAEVKADINLSPIDLRTRWRFLIFEMKGYLI